MPESSAMHSMSVRNGSIRSQARDTQENRDSRAYPMPTTEDTQTKAAVHVPYPALALDGPDAHFARVHGEVSGILQRLGNHPGRDETENATALVKPNMEQDLRGVGKQFE
ncbi:hypothetical protein CSUB01_02193 [Colletotrichum sublineola]|uniref:Uncharacterized protein n=1 Tax=Colletotrichum sublineola TaxID=1173701 RepID=A0A066X2U7_COLSU|nr:hypothetical protein CSUB01_02193 [Colletotrichum sublineola]